MLDDLHDDTIEAEDHPSAEPRPIARQAAYESDRIGDILRRVREHRDEDLEEISDYLRIRPNYLFALENSRYEDLPADAYVIGFLRTYATYLGLDGKGAIDQYRREMMGRRRKPQLSMPQPMSEGRAPTIAVIVAAAIAALIIYGIWYGLSSPDKEALKAPIPLPETTTQTPDKTLIPATEPLPQTTQQSPASAATTTLTTQTATSDGIALSVPEAAIPAHNESAAPVVEPTEPADAKPETPAVPAKDTAKDKPSSKPDKKSEQEVTPPASATKEQEQAETIKEEPPKQEQAAVYGDKKSKSHLTIKADKESWVLVTDDRGNTIFDRTLKAGETYNVPTQKGLRLTTGNANGISFTYNDKALPKLHNDTPVVRALSLDTDTLKRRLNGEELPPSDPDNDQ